MKTDHIQVFSPAWVQKKWEASENLLMTYLRSAMKNSAGTWALFLAIACGTIFLFACLPKGLWPSDSLAEKSVKVFVPVFALITCFWKIFFPHFLKGEEFLSRWNLVIFFSGFFVFLANAKTRTGHFDPFLFGASYFLVIFLSFCAQKTLKRSWNLVFITSLFFCYAVPLGVLLVAGEFLSLEAADYHFVHLARFGMPLVLALAENQSSAFSSLFQIRSFGLTAQLLHPVQWIYFIPVSKKNAPTEQSWRENLPLVFPLLMRLLLIAALRWALRALARQPNLFLFEFSPKTLAHGWLIYFFYFCLSYVLINSSVLIGRLFGLKLPDASDFALLATTPVERWRRWNTYFYDWIFRFVFFPFQKSFKKPFLTIQISFMVTYFFHAAIYWTILFFPHEIAGNEFFIRNKFLFFFTEGVLVYLSRFFPAQITAAGKRSGWIGVILTHFLMAMTYSLHNI